MARSQGAKPNEFLRLYRAKRSSSVGETVETTALGAAIVALLNSRKTGISGLLKDVHATLESYHLATASRERPDKDWPRPGKDFGNQLRRLQPSLRLIGILVEIGKVTNKGTTCSIRRAIPS